MITVVLVEPMEGLDLDPELRLGPFASVTLEDNVLLDGDGNQIAEIFVETTSDMLNIIGHPAAGKIFVPRTFSQHESDDPDYPGYPYGRVHFEVS